MTLPDGALGIVVGDVCGHGFGPALLMSATRAYLRALLLTQPRVGDVMVLLNRILAADLDDGRFVTLILARLDPHSRLLSYCSAGHTRGFVLTPDGLVRSVIESTALPLGLFDDSEFPEGPALTLEAGEIVLLLTDGVVEANNPERVFFGYERALEVVRANRKRPASEIVEALYQAVCAFTRNSIPFDDVTCLVIKVGETAKPTGRSVRMAPPSNRAPGEAHPLARRDCGGSPPSDGGNLDQLSLPSMPCCSPHVTHAWAISRTLPMASGGTGFCSVIDSKAQNH